MAAFGYVDESKLYKQELAGLLFENEDSEVDITPDDVEIDDIVDDMEGVDNAVGLAAMALGKTSDSVGGSVSAIMNSMKQLGDFVLNGPPDEDETEEEEDEKIQNQKKRFNPRS